MRQMVERERGRCWSTRTGSAVTRRNSSYGWASWSPTSGILTLRNPADRAQDVDIDVARVFELPDNAPRDYVARSPWMRDRERAPVRFKAGKTQSITLAPFEVLTLQSGLP